MGMVGVGVMSDGYGMRSAGGREGQKHKGQGRVSGHTALRRNACWVTRLNGSRQRSSGEATRREKEVQRSAVQCDVRMIGSDEIRPSSSVPLQCFPHFRAARGRRCFGAILLQKVLPSLLQCSKFALALTSRTAALRW